MQPPSPPSRDASLKVGRSSLLYSLGILISRTSGMMREMFTAYFFGATAEMGSFFLAFRFSHLLRRLCGEGGLLIGFVPQYMRYRTESASFAFSFFKKLLFYLFCFLGGGVILFELFSWGNASFEIQLTQAFLPGLLLVCLSGFLAAFLQCEGKFFLSGAISALFNVAWVTSCVLTNHLPIKQGLIILAWATTFSFFLQLLFLAIPTIRIMMNVAREMPEPVQEQNLSFRKVFRPLLMSLTFSSLAVGVSQVNGFIDTLFAKLADPRGPALLSYAIRLQQFPLSLFAISASTALMPTLSGFFKAEDRAHFIETFSKTWTAVMGMLLLSSVVLCVIGESGLELVLGRGKFNTVDLLETTQVLWCYALSLVPMGSHLLLSAACYSLNKGRQVVISSCLALAANCVLNSFCVFGLGLGVKSIAIATAISTLFAALYLGRALKELGVKLPLRAFMRRLLYSIILGVILESQLYLWFNDPSIDVLYGVVPSSISGLNSFIRLAFGGSMTLILGYVASKMGKIEEWNLFGALKRLLLRRGL